MPKSWRLSNREAMAQPKPLWNGQAGVDQPLPPRAPVLHAPPVVASAPPVLEVNRLPRKNLRLLIDAVGQRQVERDLDVHRTTIKRWLSGEVKIPGAQHLAIRYLLGDLPGTEGKWRGWRFAFGELVSPAGDRYVSGEVLAIRLQQQRVEALDREMREQRIRIAVLEQTVDRYGAAANESHTHPFKVTESRT